VERLRLPDSDKDRHPFLVRQRPILFDLDAGDRGKLQPSDDRG
jgi:hypothetical protein